MRKRNDVKVTLSRSDARKLDDILQFMFDRKREHEGTEKIDIKRNAEVRFKGRKQFCAAALSDVINSCYKVMRGEVVEAGEVNALEGFGRLDDFISRIPVN